MNPQAGTGPRLAVGTAVNGAGAVVGQLLTLATLMIGVTRVGAPAYAFVVLGQSLPQWPLLTEKGVGFAVIRLLAREDDEATARPLLHSALVVYAGLAVVTLVFGLAAGRALSLPVFHLPRGIHSEGMLAFEILVVATTLRMATGFIPRALLGETRLVELRVIEMSRDITALLATLVLVRHRPEDVVRVAVALLLGDVVATLLGLAVRPAKRVGIGLRSATRSGLMDHWRASRPLLATGALSLLSSRLDPLILSVARGPAAVATYGVVLRLVEALTGAVALVSIGATPATTRALAAGHPTRVAELFRRASSYGALLVWPAAVTIAVFADPVARERLHTTLPQLGSAAGMAMALVIVSTPLVAASAVITGADRVAATLRSTALGVAVDVGISLALSRRLGVPAVLLGSVVGNALVLRAWLGIVGETGAVSPRSLLSGLHRAGALAVVLLACLVAVRVGVAGNVATVALVGLAALAYGAVALTWVIPRRDLRAMLGLARGDGKGTR